MIIPSSSHGVIASGLKRVVAVASDFTPNAVNWADVYYNGDIGFFGYSERQITGISSSITLKIQISSVGLSDLYYFVSSSPGSIVSGDGELSQDPEFLGMTLISNNGTINVSNNQYVTFGTNPSAFDTLTVTVKNQSDGDATLDTFIAYYQGEL
jgi:hypothetical protein